jgi:hypothetical protein
MMAAYRVKMLV